jgi:hypothetical protein
MSVEAIPGGKRRIDRVLDPRFVAGIEVEELTRAVEALTREEEAVSANRQAMQHIVGLLRGELARRYRNGTASVAQLL